MPTLAVPGKEGIKVACLSCIKGHRTATCNHLNRILIQIKQPGRPRLRCSHKLGADGPERCPDCNPTVAYVVPGHLGGKCRRTKDKASLDTPIENWEETAFDVAKEHEQQWERRQARRRAKISQSAGKRANSTAGEAQQAGSKVQSHDQTEEHVLSTRSRVASQHFLSLTADSVSKRSRADTGDSTHQSLSGQSSPRTKTEQNSLHEQPRDDAPTEADMVAVPWTQSRDGLASNSHGGECTCTDSECCCAGCSIHVDNPATMEIVRQGWNFQKSNTPLPTGDFLSFQDPGRARLSSPSIHSSLQNNSTSLLNYNAQSASDFRSTSRFPSPGLPETFAGHTLACLCVMGQYGCECGTGCTCTGCTWHAPNHATEFGEQQQWPSANELITPHQPGNCASRSSKMPTGGIRPEDATIAPAQNLSHNQVAAQNYWANDIAITPFQNILSHGPYENNYGSSNVPGSMGHGVHSRSNVVQNGAQLGNSLAEIYGANLPSFQQPQSDHLSTRSHLSENTLSNELINAGRSERGIMDRYILDIPSDVMSLR